MDSSAKLYRVGMYGGKFMPMHIGHLRCLEIASKECEVVYCVLFCGGAQEKEIIAEHSNDYYLSLNQRIHQLYRASKMFGNVIPVVIDVSSSIMPDGKEDWDLQTPMVIRECGLLDAVYGSEPSYAEYFARAYPNAEYRMLDPNRDDIHISATDIRAMPAIDRMRWIV